MFEQKQDQDTILYPRQDQDTIVYPDINKYNVQICQRIE